MQTLVEKLPTVARFVLGAVFLLFGLNGFLHFLPQPPLPAAAIPFISGLASASYFFPLLKGVEIVSALLLLSNRFVRSEEHTSELQSRLHLVCRLLLEKKNTKHKYHHSH